MSGEGHHVPDTYKALDLKPAGLETQVRAETDGRFTLDITARGLALFVLAESEVPGRFSDNLFDLAAGDARRVIFTPRDPMPAGTTPAFRLYDLQSSQTVAG